MHALHLLREMHADAKTQFKLILATEDPTEADKLWRELQPTLDLHERLEDEFVYTPVAQESASGSPLADWHTRHEADIAIVKQLIAGVDRLSPKSPEWRMQIARIADALMRHVTDEEGQIFGRIEQFWGSDRLLSAGKDMNKAATREPVASGARTKATTSRRGTK